MTLSEGFPEGQDQNGDRCDDRTNRFNLDWENTRLNIREVQVYSFSVEGHGVLHRHKPSSQKFLH